MKRFNLEPESATPLHVQFASELKKRLRKNEWGVGEKIASERELMELANLSRATIRQAINSLVQEGVLEKSHGSGTFVATPKIEQPMNSAYSFSQQFKERGLELTDTLLERKLIKADETLSHKLQLRKNSQVIYLHRLRLVDKTPFMVSKTYVPYALCPALLDEPLDTTLYQLLVERHALPVLKATDKIEAMTAGKDLSKELLLPPHVPVLFVERLATTTHERILHLGLNYIRADKCSFRIDLTSQASVLELKSV